VLISDESLLRKYINNLIFEGFTPQNPSISFVDSSKFINPIYNKICKEILPLVLGELNKFYPDLSQFIFKSFNNKYTVHKDKLLNALSDPAFITSILSKLPDLKNFIDINEMLTPDNVRFIKLINNNLGGFKILNSDTPFNVQIFFSNNDAGLWSNNITNINIPKDAYAGFFQLVGYKQTGIECYITFNLFHFIYHSFFIYYVGVTRKNDSWENVFNKYLSDSIKIQLLKVIRHELEHAFQTTNNLLNKMKTRLINYINPILKQTRNKERKIRAKDRLAGKNIAIPIKSSIVSFLKDKNTDYLHFKKLTLILLETLRESPSISIQYSVNKKRKGYGFTKTNPNILKYSNQKYVNQNNNIASDRESKLYRYDPVEIIPQLNDLVMSYVFAAAGFFANVESAIDWFFEFIESDLFKEKYAFEKDSKTKTDILEAFLKNSNCLKNKEFVIDDVLINNKLPYKSFNFTEDFNEIINEFINNFNYITIGQSDLLFDLLSVKSNERNIYFDESTPTVNINRSESVLTDTDILNDPQTKSVNITDLNNYRDKLGKEIKNLFIKKMKKLWQQKNMLNINLDI